MPTLINTTVQKHKRGSRIWLEGQRIQREGFLPGLRYTIIEKDSCLILSICEEGCHLVSRRHRNGHDLPIIDLTSRALETLFYGVERIRVLVRRGCIIISAHYQCIERKDREVRITNRIRANTPLSLGSLFHGGGVLDKAIHHGFANAGVNSTISIAVEIDGQYLDSSIANNPELWDSQSIPVESGVQYLQMSDKSPRLDGVCAGIPCTGASLSGRSKLKLAFAEDHSGAGACFFWFLLFVQKVNPAFIIIENVPTYATTASASVIRSVLTTLGYEIKERVFGGNDFGALEDRYRWVLVALSKGLFSDFDLESVQPVCSKPTTIGDVLDQVSADADTWKSYEYLAEKESKDRNAGKGFRRQLLSPEDDRCGTIGRSYNKARSTEPFLKHPTDGSLSRLFTPGEHARLKGIPESVIHGLSATTAHEVLGQSVIYPAFVAIAQAIARHLLTVAGKSPGQVDVAA